MPQDTCIGNRIHGKHFAFTGRLALMTRMKAAGLITLRGGLFQNSVTTKTDYLVVGDNSYHKTCFPDQSRKLFHAHKLRSSGHRIEIISEEEFIFLIWTCQ